jgi:hypothetical protein
MVVCSAKAEPEASKVASTAAPASFKRIENPPFSIAVRKRTRLN